MNIIIQALVDAKNTLEIFRNRCNAQEWEKVSAQIAHLQYLATTTEVMPMLPSTVAPGDVLPASDTTLLRTAQDAINGLASSTSQTELKTHKGITTAGRVIAAGMERSHDDPGICPEAEIAAILEADKKLAADLRSITEEDLMRMNPDPDRVTKNLVGAKASAIPAGHPSEAYIGRDSKHAIRWVPEAPDHPGLYAFEPKVTGDARNCTCNISDAMQFMFKQQCVDWCAKHPVPRFVATEHMFMTDCR